MFMDQKAIELFGQEGAHSPMVEHVVCNDEIRVRFPMGPFKIK